MYANAICVEKYLKLTGILYAEEEFSYSSFYLLRRMKVFVVSMF